MQKNNTLINWAQYIGIWSSCYLRPERLKHHCSLLIYDSTSLMIYSICLKCMCARTHIYTQTQIAHKYYYHQNLVLLTKKSYAHLHYHYITFSERLETWNKKQCSFLLIRTYSYYLYCNVLGSVHVEILSQHTTVFKNYNITAEHWSRATHLNYSLKHSSHTLLKFHTFVIQFICAVCIHENDIINTHQNKSALK